MSILMYLLEGSVRFMEKADVLVVGAGFAGLRALYKFRSLGYKVQV
jgi:succinate dehydrogenase/fumarate reductase flavoprotein subunit